MKNIEDVSFAQDFMNNCTNDLTAQLLKKQENVLLDALEKAGVAVINLEQIVNRMQVVNIEGDKFNHYYLDYGTEDEKRIISIEKTPSMQWEQVDNQVKMVLSSKCY